MSGNDDPTMMPTPSPNPDEATLPVSNEPTDSIPVKEFGDYELLDEIARGGMGVVYRARQVSLNRVVALKMILSGQFASDSDVRRFYQEAESAANLDHSGIVPIYDIGEHDGRHFFSMKFIEGGSLADALPELRKKPKKMVKLIADVARAVHHAHQRGILHRDLKPANILLDDAGNPLVSDLGLAKQIQSDSNITNTGAVVGTPAYMPPEQAAAKKEITTAADIYSIGAVLYEALTERPPHKADSPMQTLMLVMDGDVTPPREIDRSIHRNLELICMKCLESDPNMRYSSAAALAEDLENWLDGKPVSVRPPSMASSVASAMMSNVRSAFGAGAIGIAAGLVLSMCMGEGVTRSEFVENSPTKIYEALPGEIPLGRHFIHLNETYDRDDEWVFLGILACMFGVGIGVTALTRPKPGAETLAMGLVAAMFMTITTFAMQMAPMGVGGSMLDTVLPRLESLSQISFGSKAQSIEARQALEREFPELASISESDRARVLAYRIFYDGFLSFPIAILLGFFVASLFSVFPSVIGTIFSTKLLAELGKLRRIVIPYMEFMTYVYAFLMCAFVFFLMNAGERVGGQTGAPPIGGQAVTLLILGGVSVALYRRMLHWKWRVGLFVLMLVCAVLVLKPS